MRRLLLLAYHFPPIGGAGAQRPVQLVRHLAELGYEMVVATGPGTAEGRWTPEDATLGADLPSSATVLRVAGPAPGKGGAWRRRYHRWLRIRSPWARWWIDGVASLALDDVDLLYVTMPPYESAEGAARLARRLGVPWIPDIGDPWALDEMMVYPTGIHRRLEERRMGRAFASAAAVVVRTSEAARRVRTRFPELGAREVVAIPNGYECSHFENVVPAPRDDTTFRIVHTGYLHTELGQSQRRTAAMRRLLGGQARGVDILTRSHVYLLRAIDRVIADQPDLAGRIEVHLAGVLSEHDREIAGRSPVVRTHGYLEHAQSVALLMSADLLFLPMQKVAPGERAGVVPGKTYEYLASGRPILGAVPPGDARDILVEAGNSFVCEPDDVEGMAAVIAECLRKNSSSSEGSRNQAVVERFEAGTLVQEVAALVECVCAAPQLPPP
jgi:glycosyltransferase involved in cell wall biosynthesis